MAKMERKKLKILYIMGYERSGSTFLQNLVATHPALLPVGEVHHLWDRGVKETVQCGCGKDVKACSFWQDVFRYWFGMEALEALPRKQSKAAEIRQRRKWLFLLSIWASKARMKKMLRPYLEAIRCLYEALYHVASETVWIVDSSKTPVYGWVLTLMDHIDLRILHLVRDPIATEASVWKRKRTGHPNYQGYWPGRAAARWAFWTWVNHHWFHKHPEYRLLA
ncbi:MAG: sulfotransferase, partial [Candidatus Hydrothermae bacterium]|nr:sulfotransferase [Candidatus Hydrothermae bacterium]